MVATLWRGQDGRFHTVFLPLVGAVFTQAAVAAAREVLADVSDEDAEDLVMRVQESVVEPPFRWPSSARVPRVQRLAWGRPSRSAR